MRISDWSSDVCSSDLVLATQTIRQRKSRNMRISIEGRLAPHVHAKDLALHLLALIGVDGATGHVIEYAGSAVRALSMEARMTLCNLSIEMGRSEENTSELPSLMRISYAVFCLKKKIRPTTLRP